MFLLPVMLGADCDPDVAVRTKFDHEYEQVKRDNFEVYGYFYDEQDRLDFGTYTGVVYHGSTSILETEVFFEYEGHNYYSFRQPRSSMPLALKPAPDDNLLTLVLKEVFGTGSPLPVYTALVYMDPNVIVLPVYTWRLFAIVNNSELPSLSILDETAMRYAFDRGTSTTIPDEFFRPTAGQHVDSVWTQCDIQFRLSGHFDIEVPRCYTDAAEPADEGYYPTCFQCPVTNQDCDSNTDCGCKPNGKPKCTVAQFAKLNGHFVPDAINIYFVQSFSAEYIMSSANPALTCNSLNLSTQHHWPWIIVNLSHMQYDEYFTTFAHEIGHILLEDPGHEVGTLMAAGLDSSSKPRRIRT